MANGNDVYFGRYCHACGKRHEKDAVSCPFCGARLDDRRFSGVYRTGAAGIGYSHRTDNPIFANNKRKYRRVTLIITPCIVVMIALLMMAFGVRPVIALIIGLILIVIIMPFALLSFRTKKSWEGTVTDKKCSPWHRDKRQEKYKIYFETKEGKRKVQKWNMHPAIYDYLEIGDRIRYDGEIGGSFAYEKYDKSNDDNVICVSCGYLQDARQNYCTACGSPILKGNPIR